MKYAKYMYLFLAKLKKKGDVLIISNNIYSISLYNFIIIKIFLYYSILIKQPK